MKFLLNFKEIKILWNFNEIYFLWNINFKLNVN